MKLKDLTKTSVKVHLIGLNCFLHMKFQILVNIKVELAQNSNFKLELQFELSITIQLRQSVSSKKGLFGFAYIEKYLEAQHNILMSDSELPKKFF